MTKAWCKYDENMINVWWNYGVINSVLKTHAGYTVINQPSNNLPYNTKLFKCGDSENSPLFKTYGLFY